ncbi:MAG: hypothetical protein ARM1_0768 [Candidatus Micrarchaeota archaeon]|nr:MAG: hypothetical protein ARM1_0768 [Candidatus Micrarchaeota archaeon]
MKESSNLYSLCYICGKPASKRCIICNRYTCESHIDPALNICVRCKSGLSREVK